MGDTKMILGALVLVVGVAIGLAVGPDISDVEDKMTAGAEASEARFAALDGRLDEITSAIAELKTTAAAQADDAATALSEGMASLSGDVEAAAAALSDDVKTAAATQSAALADLAAAPAQAAPAATPAPASATAATAEDQTPQAAGAGQTAILLDGAARIFVSSARAGEREARVAVNGTSTMILRVGERFDVDDHGCGVVMNAIGDDGAVFAPAC